MLHYDGRIAGSSIHCKKWRHLRVFNHDSTDVGHGAQTVRGLLHRKFFVLQHSAGQRFINTISAVQLSSLCAATQCRLKVYQYD